MFFLNNYLYYIPIGLQALCAIHCIRKGNQQKWLYIIIFLPVIGSLIYLYSEVISGRRIGNVASGVASGVSSALFPAGVIRRLEEQLRFADTFHNRVALADGYLAIGKTNEAIDLYEKSLNGVFTENEHVIRQLIVAYYNVSRFDAILPLAKRMYATPQFARSREHMLYAIALDYTGNSQQAEKEFRLMNGRYADFEARYQYALFLYRHNRDAECKALLETVVDEGRHLSSRERRANSRWISEAREELRSLNNRHTAAPANR
jgi:hypothetical protein